VTTTATAPVIEFDAATHTYTVDGRIVPSVTQIIGAAGLVDYEGVPAWRLEEARWRGSAVHQACWYLDQQDLDWSTVNEQHRGYLDAWEAFQQDSGFQIRAIEQRLFNPIQGYAGTADRFGLLPVGQREGVYDEAVIDLKTGELQPGAAIQLAAYAMCCPEPFKLRRLAVRLKPDGRYVVKEYENRLMRDFQVFQHALAIWRWKEEYL
jgi:hypothetical protein